MTAAFGDALGNGFVFDDQQYLLGNPLVNRGLSWTAARGTFTSFHAANWHPVTWLSHMLDVSLFGLAPAGHHGASLLLHALNAVLLHRVLSRLTGKPGMSLAVALLFALHPLRVESVAWVAERKDLLAGLFFLLSLGAYRAWLARPSMPRMALLLLVFALGLGSKPMVVTLPALLLLLDYWPLGRFRAPTLAAASRLVLEKVPLFLLACAVAAITVIAQARGGAVADLEQLPLAVRLLNAPAAYASYVGQTLLPFELAVFYPYRQGWPLVRAAVAGAVLLVLITTLVLKEWRARPAAPVGWCWFLGMLVPVLGLLQVGEQAQADRYTYLPQIGLFVGLLFSVELGGWRRCARVAFGALVAAVALLLATVSRSAVHVWRSDATLFSRAAAVTEGNWMANFNLALALSAEGGKDEARRRLETAIAQRPQFAKARQILGLFLEREGRDEEAAVAYREALRLEARLLSARTALAGLAVREGRPEEAILILEEGLKPNPSSPELLGRLGNILSDLGRSEEALSRYRQALAAAPERPELHYDLAVELVRRGRMGEAEEPLREVIRLAPGLAAAWNHLGVIAARKGGYREAAGYFSRALALDPANEDARANLLRARALLEP